MKLAILGTRGIPACHGGFETFAEEISTRLAAAGHEITVVCPTDSPLSDKVYRGVRLTYVKVPRMGVLSQLLWDAKCFVLAAGRYDVVYMLGTGGSFAAWIPRLFGAEVWINNDGLEWLRKKWNIWGRAYVLVSEALSALFSSMVIADSHAISEYLKSRYHGLACTSTIAYGAYPITEQTNPKLLDEWNLQSNQYYIVVCRLEPENHVLEIVRGYEESNSQLPLIVLGNIRDLNKYIRKLLEHQSPRIRFIGTVYDQKRLVLLRSQARAYIHGHSVGGTNPSLLEAMACSNLVLAHDNVFNREVLGDTGIFFKTERDLASAINAIDCGKTNVEQLRSGAFQRICLNYRWDQIADAYLDLLRLQR